MAGYIGKSQGVTQVDGYNRSEADAEFVNDPNDVITVSGSNVGIGTSSPAVGLEVSGSMAVSDTTTSAKRLQLDSGANSHTINSANYGSDMMDLNIQAENLIFNTGLIGVAERMRIDSSGVIRLGNLNEQLGGGGTNYLACSGNGYASLRVRRGSDAGNGVLFYGPNSSSSAVGSIDIGSSSVSYVTSSDYRLKENVTPLDGAADRLAQIPVHRFNFITDPDTTVDGFLAHEVQAFVPEAITGEHDGVDADGNPEYQGIDQSKLVPLLTAALQEALQKIDALEARVATLEGGAA